MIRTGFYNFVRWLTLLVYLNIHIWHLLNIICIYLLNEGLSSKVINVLISSLAVMK